MRALAALALLTTAVADAGPVDPQALPEIKLAADPVKGEPHPTAIYAADANLDQLLIELVPRGFWLVTLATGQHVTGKLQAPTREAAFTAIAGRLDRPGFGSKLIHGKAPTVTVLFYGAPAAPVLRLLSTVMNTNIVAAPGELPAIDIAVDRAPSDGVLDRLADAMGRDAIRLGDEVYVVPHGTKLASPVKPIGSTITIDVHDATPSDALLAISRVVPLDVHVACDAGPKLDLRLHKIDARRAAYAIAIASGLDLQPGGGACDVDIPRLPMNAMAGKLTAIVTRGEDHTALIVDGRTRWFVKRVQDTTDVGTGYVTFIDKPNGKAQSVLLRESLPPVSGRDAFDISWTKDPWRLAATIIDATHPRALLEGRAGDSMVIDHDTTQGKVTIEPARVLVELTDPRFNGAPSFERALSRR